MNDLNHEAVAERPFSYDDIEWHGGPSLHDTELWERNLGVIRLLLENGGVPGRIIDNDSANNIPAEYDFDGLTVEFLPHWGFYQVGSLYLRTPDGAGTLEEDIAVARQLQAAQEAAGKHVERRAPVREAGRIVAPRLRQL